MALTYDLGVSIEMIVCADCGMSFGAPEHWVDKLRQSHKGFYCPAGHSLVFKGKSDVEKERERRIVAEAARARAEDRAEVAERRRRAEKGQKTKVLNRIKNGVCPFCKRSFGNVVQHMETEHADQDVHADA